MKLSRIPTLTFERASGMTIEVKAPTRAQIREVYALDPERRKTPMDADEQRAAQVAILLRQARCTDPAGQEQPLADVLGDLTAEEEQDILNAIICAHHGLDPQNAVELQQALRSLAVKKKAATRAGKTG